MKKLISAIASFVLVLAGLMGISAPAKASQLEVLGATVTWDASSLFEPTGCSNFNFSYSNGTGLRLLQLEFQVKSRFGDSVIRESQIGIPAGTSGQWRVQVCKSRLVDGLGPYVAELSIEDYQGTVRVATGSLSFVSRSGGGTAPSNPAPAPAPGSPAQLEVLGATVTWDASSLFEPTGCSNFNFSYSNGTGLRLLQLEFQVKSRFGDSVIRESQIGIPAGTSGQWRVQVCKSRLVDGLGPYVAELSIEDYQGTVRVATGSLSFVSRSGGGTAPSNPAPAPGQISPSQGVSPAAKQVSMRAVSNPGSGPEDLVALSPTIQRSVVTITCAGGQGSGWSAEISPTAAFTQAGYRSYVITNHHVIEDCIGSGTVTVISPTGQNLVGKILSFDVTNDLAGVAVSSEIPALSWQGQTPAQAWWVGVMGTPRGVQGVLTTGIVSRVNESSGIVNVTAPLNPGNSGGPVFDRMGRVIAVVSAKYTNSEGFGIAQGVTLLCQRVVVCNSGTSGVWSSTGLVSTDAPQNSPVARKSVLLGQRTLATFPGTVRALSSTQRSQVASAVASFPGAGKFICTGIRLNGQPQSVNIMVRSRAKAACDYAKSLNPDLSTWVQSKPTTARSYAGKVLLTIKSP